MGEKNKCDYETALDNYNSWKKSWLIDEPEESSDSKEQFEISKKLILDLMQSGNLLFDEDENYLEYFFRKQTEKMNNESIKLYEPMGDLSLAGDKYAETEYGHRANSALAVLAKKPPKHFTLIHYKDLKNLQGVVGHFLLG